MDDRDGKLLSEMNIPIHSLRTANGCTVVEPRGRVAEEAARRRLSPNVIH